MSLLQSTQSNQPLNTSSPPQQVVINTRPIERAAPLTRHLQAAGLTVIDMPMLALQALAMTEADMQLMRQWFAGHYQVLVIVSPTAAAAGLAVWQALEHEANAQDSNSQDSNSQDSNSQDSNSQDSNSQDSNAQDSNAKDSKEQNEAAIQQDTSVEISSAPSHLIAVGEATAAVLHKARLQAANYQVLQPTIANNEGMLVMPEIESLQTGDKLLVWRGLGGRRLLADTLQARGVHIDSIAWYERVMPADAKAHYEYWLQSFSRQQAAQGIVLSSQTKPIVIISSGTAFEYWVTIVGQVPAVAAESKSDTNLNERLAVSLNNTVPLKLADFAYLVLGTRLAHMVAEQQLNYYRVEDLAPETILAAIEHMTR
ncbi:uroporphyrinogen-III synthase [Psychrobacter sp. PL19]